MRISLVAERYAKALFDLAVEQHQEEAVYKDALLLEEVCRESKEFVFVMKSPVISEEKKERILRDLFEKRCTELTIKFLLLLVRKNRELYIEDIAVQIIRFYKEYKHILPVTLTTAVEPTEAIRNKVKELVHAYSHWKVEIHEKIDPGIIGGFILTWNDLQYDASIRYQLERLRRGSARINLYKKGF